MLVLERNRHQWLRITDASGHILMVRAVPVGGDTVRLIFDDSERHFAIDRAERARGTVAHVGGGEDRP